MMTKLQNVKVTVIGESESLRGVERQAGKGNHFICNGWVISAQSGWGNYCSSDPTRAGGVLTSEIGTPLTASTIREDCEVAIWPSPDNKDEDNDKWVNTGKGGSEELNNPVRGWVPYSVVFRFLSWLMTEKDVPEREEVREKFLEFVREDENNDE